MWEQLIEMAQKEGLFALLFVGLLVYNIKNNKQREERYITREEKYIDREIKYQTLVERLSQIIKNELKEIKEKIINNKDGE